MSVVRVTRQSAIRARGFVCTSFDERPQPEPISPDQLVRVLNSASEPGPDREYVLIQTFPEAAK